MDAYTLSDFQNDFAAALLGRGPLTDPRMAALTAQPAFAVYRNGVMKSAIDALQASYPAIVRLVGEEWFRAAAAEYFAIAPPASPRLIDYGHGFAEFLDAFPAAADLPYLAGVARIERFWTEAHIAASEPVMDPRTLAKLAPTMLAAAMLEPHPAARWHWFDAMPIYTLWHRNRTGVELDADLEWRGEGVLVTRPQAAVLWHPLGPGGCAFLDACAAREPVAVAAQTALDAEPEIDLSQLMAQLLTCGALHAIHFPDLATE